jgi:hypothetical protein
MTTEVQVQKYPDGDCRRRFGGSQPVSRSTSKGRGTGSIGSSILRATAWKDLDGAKVVPNPRDKNSVIAVNRDGLGLVGSFAMMVLARFARRGRGR